MKTSTQKQIVNNHFKAFRTGEFDIESGITRDELIAGKTSRTLWKKLFGNIERVSVGKEPKLRAKLTNFLEFIGI